MNLKRTALAAGLTAGIFLTYPATADAGIFSGSASGSGSGSSSPDEGPTIEVPGTGTQTDNTMTTDSGIQVGPETADRGTWAPVTVIPEPGVLPEHMGQNAGTTWRAATPDEIDAFRGNAPVPTKPTNVDVIDGQGKVWNYDVLPDPADPNRVLWVLPDHIDPSTGTYWTQGMNASQFPPGVVGFYVR